MTKSWKKARNDIFTAKYPKHYYAVGVLTASLLVGCGGDGGWWNIVPPKPTKTDHPTSYTFKTTGLPTGVSVDTVNKTLTVPESVSDADIKKLFEYGTVSDADGNANLKTISLSGDKVTLTLQGKNGKTGDIDTTTQIWTVKRMAIVAHFPEILPETDNNTITAGDENFFAQLFAFEFSLSDGSKVKASTILVNGLAVDAKHMINRPGNYTFTIIVRDKQGKEHQKKLIVDVLGKAIETEDLSTYNEVQFPKLMKNQLNLTPRIQAMGVPWLQKILEHNILTPSEKTTTVLEIGEIDHIFWDYMKKIIENIGSIQYKLLSLQDYTAEYNQDFKNDLQNFVNDNTNNWDFIITEDNSGWARNGTNIWNIFENNTQTYAAFSEGFDGEYEKLAQKGYGKVSLPGYKHKNGKRYLYLNVGRWWDTESDPFINTIDEPLYIGIDFWSSSGASAANAATWALGADLLHRLGYAVDRKFFNSIFTDPKYAGCFEDAYWIDDEGKLGIKNKEYKKGKVLIWNKFIEVFETFALNIDAIKTLQKGQRVPLMKYWDKIDHTHLHIAEKKGIISEEKNGKTIFYLDYDLLEQQIGDPKTFLENPHYDYLIGDKNTKTFYWKP